MAILNQMSLVHTTTFIFGIIAILTAAISRLRYATDKKVMGASRQAVVLIGVGLVLISVGFSINDLVNTFLESLLVITGFGMLGWGAYVDRQFRKDDAV